MNKHVAFVLCVFISLQVNAQNTYNEEDFDVLYKNALQYMAQEQYENAAWNWEELEKIEKSSHAPLYQGQTYYHLGRYNEAVAKLTEYLNQSGEVYSEEALYWIGECLFAMGQFDKAKLIFLNFMKDYAQSIKAEKVKYRLDLIEHKKILDELLELLHWSHEESLRAVNSYQKQERFYEQTINNLQQTINGLQKQISDLKKEIALFDFDKIGRAHV